MRYLSLQFSPLILIFCRGPLVLLRIELGVLSRGNLRPLELVSEYIQQNDIEKVIRVLCNLYIAVHIFQRL